MLQQRTCRQCSSVFQGGPRAYYCPSCRHERKKLAKVLHLQRKRNGEARQLGSADDCERCGKSYTVESGLQRFCPDCQPIHNAEYDRKTSLEFYREHKDRLNPPRKIKRRKNNGVCVVCNNKFEPVNGSVTCSDECKRQHRNRTVRNFYVRQRKKLASVEIKMKKGDVKRCVCGKEFVVRSYVHRYCDACAKDRKHNRTLSWIRSSARKILREKTEKGTATRINETKLCECGEKFIKRSYTHKYCEKCAVSKRKKIQKEYYETRRKHYLSSLVKRKSKGRKR